MFSVILGKCSQQLLNQMKQDVICITVTTSSDQLQLISIINKTVLAQTEDQYPFAIVYEQELLLYSFHQNTMTMTSGMTNSTPRLMLETPLESQGSIQCLCNVLHIPHTANLIKKLLMIRRLKFKRMHRKGTSHTSS